MSEFIRYILIVSAVLIYFLVFILNHFYDLGKLKFNKLFFIGIFLSIMGLPLSIYSFIDFITNVSFSFGKIFFIALNIFLIKGFLSISTFLIKKKWMFFTNDICKESIEEIIRISNNSLDKKELKRLQDLESKKINDIEEFLDFLVDYTNKKEVLDKVNNIRDILENKTDTK